MFKYPLFNLNFDSQEEKAVLEVLQSKWISTGPKVKEFEDLFSDQLGVNHSLALTNCTVALHLAMLISNIGPGDEVICPSLTFVATINAIKYVGAIPIFCDIVDVETPVMDPVEIEKKITSRTKAICVMHHSGFNPVIGKIKELSDRHNLILIEDACHAPLSIQDGKYLGTYGDISCYSFFSNKNISIGEGGMICIKDTEKYEAAKLLRSHGMTSLSYERSKGHSASYDVVKLGYNYRMDDIRASIGIVQTMKFIKQIPERAMIRKDYIRFLKKENADIIITFENCHEQSSNYIFPIVLPERFNMKKKEILRARLAESGLQTSAHYPPVHKFSLYSHLDHELPYTENFYERTVTIPFYVGLHENDLEFITRKISDEINLID